MQVRYDEGIANHIGPEPCADFREDVGEASVGDSIGQPLSRESEIEPGADAVLIAEGETDGRVTASDSSGPARSETQACADAPCAGTGRFSCLTRAARRSWSASGRRGAEAGDARA